MEHVITSMMILKYSIKASWEEANKIKDDFLYHQIYKGNRPDEFYNRPTILDEKSLCSIANADLAIAYQFVELEYSVEKAISNAKFIKLFKANLLENLRTKFNDGNYDQVQDLKVLDHVILSREDRDE